MNKQTWLNIIATLSLLTPLTPATLPILAQTTPLNSQEQPTNIQQSIENNTLTIPKSTAIIINFSSNVQFDAGGKESLPVILRLVEPIIDSSGNIIVPANSRVDALIVPTDKSAKIIANSLIINGKVVPIKASSQMIPSVKVTLKTRMEQAKNYALSVGRFGPTVLVFDNESDSNDMIKSAIIAQGIGAIVGFLSPRSIDVANFVQNSEYILTLEEAITLPQETKEFKSSGIQ